MFEFVLLNNKNGKKDDFFIKHLFIEHESIKFLFKTFTIALKLTMNKNQEIFLKFNKVVRKNQACLEKS